MEEDFRSQYLEKVRGLIDARGWAVQGVFGTREEPGSFVYTIGLTETLGHPEVYLCGFPMEVAEGLLNDVGELVRGGYDFREPCLCDTVIRNYDVAFRPLSPESVREKGNVGVQALGKPFEAVQLFLPDAEGRFPWDDGCQPDYVRLQTADLEAVGDIPTARAGLPRPH